MTKSLLIVSFFLLTGFNLIAQNPPTTKELAEKYSEYFSLDRESVFLHLNKTTVAPGEDLWFSAYSYNPRLSLPNNTTNLHVNIYNRKGELLEAKIVYMEKGQGAGYFKLDPELFPPGYYLMRAYTGYMENFEEDRSFTQEFTILGQQPSLSGPIAYDLQLLPSGGHFVADIRNTVGVKLIDNSGRGVPYVKGEIINSEGLVVNSFELNRFGLSKFNFVPKENEDYFVEIQLDNGEILRNKIAEPENLGMVISSISMKDRILFSIKTNEATFNSLDENEFLFAFHKDGAMKALKFSFPKESLEANFTLINEALFPGVNTITVFNQNMEPVLERLVFNRRGISRKQLTAEYARRMNDSLILSLNSMDSLGMHSVSVSVLPAGTEAYRPDHNIFSAFYIKPYIKGNLENSGYYFSDNVNRRRRNYDLDLLLLTQGWSKYSWHDIFNNTPKEYYEHERGFTIGGKVINWKDKYEKLYIGSDSNDISVIVDLDEEGAFRIENSFLRDSSKISFSLLNNRNENLSKPSVNVFVTPTRDTENIVPWESTPKKRIALNQEEQRSGTVNDQPGRFIIGAEELETIFLEAETPSIREKDILKERELNRSSAFGRTYLISEDEARSHPRIIGLLRTMGFVVRNGKIYSRRELSRAPLSGGFGQPAQPASVFINGNIQYDLTFVLGLYSDKIESIYTSKTTRGAAAYIAGPGGVVKITLKNPQSYSGGRELTSSAILENGFATNKEFYAPNYRSYSNSFFEYYGVIGWFPEVVLKNGEAAIEIFNTLSPGLRLFIEGMTAEGALISEEIVIDL